MDQSIIFIVVGVSILTCIMFLLSLIAILIIWLSKATSENEMDAINEQLYLNDSEQVIDIKQKQKKWKTKKNKKKSKK